ncbi:MAG: hypothetical protein GY725_03960 [bacterium]|nr:hypothetical protein [bacterium]
MSGDPITGLLWFAVFVVSVSAHEAAHAYAALRGGDPTAYIGGQVTLNPIPHMKREPFGMLVLPLLFALTRGYCIGWASTPYDPAWEQRYPRRAAWMAAAGPAANLAIALFSFVILKIGLANGNFMAPDSVTFSHLVASATGAAGVGHLLSIALMLNVILFIFNMIPVPPLDGAAIITLFLSDDAALRIREVLRTPVLTIGLFVVVWMFLGPMMFSVAFDAVVELLHPGIYR